MTNQAEVFAKIIYTATKDKDDKEKERVVKRVVEFLRKKRRIYLLSRILECYERYLKRKKGVLIFARATGEATANEVRRVFSDILQEADMVEIRTDKNIIGGFILKTENFLVDASARGFLDKIRNKFSI